MRYRGSGRLAQALAPNKAVPKLIILPGADGTGSLLNNFVASLGNLNSSIVTYPADQALGYEELVQIVLPQLPTGEPYFLLGESFGGPLAISLAAAQRGSLAGLILCASFARYPPSLLRGLGPLAALVPAQLVPLPILSWFLLGRWSTPELRANLARALTPLSPRTLRARVRAALHVDVSSSLAKLCVPVLYLEASHDRVVPATAGRAVLTSTPRASLKQVHGPHFLLQAAPGICANEVRRFVGF